MGWPERSWRREFRMARAARCLKLLHLGQLRPTAAEKAGRQEGAFVNFIRFEHMLQLAVHMLLSVNADTECL
jgi:hypothetical protein